VLAALDEIVIRIGVGDQLEWLSGGLRRSPQFSPEF